MAYQSVAETIHALSISPCPCQFRACWLDFQLLPPGLLYPLGPGWPARDGDSGICMEGADRDTNHYQQTHCHTLVDRQVRWAQWCAGKCLTTGSVGKVRICSMHQFLWCKYSNISSFSKLSNWCHWKWNWEKLLLQVSVSQLWVSLGGAQDKDLGGSWSLSSGGFKEGTVLLRRKMGNIYQPEAHWKQVGAEGFWTCTRALLVCQPYEEGKKSQSRKDRKP